MALSEGSNPPLVNEKKAQMMEIRALQEKVEEKAMMIKVLQEAVQQPERERKERVTAQVYEYRKRWYPYIVLTEEERAREMLGMLRPDIARAIRESDELPTTIVDCFGRALRAKYRLTQIQAEKAKKKEVCRQQSKRKDNPSTSKITHSQGKKKKLVTATSCEKCGRNHKGECRYGTSKCFRCGQEGHQVRNCANKCAEESGPSVGVDNAGNNRTTPIGTGV